MSYTRAVWLGFIFSVDAGEGRTHDNACHCHMPSTSADLQGISGTQRYGGFSLAQTALHKDEASRWSSPFLALLQCQPYLKWVHEVVLDAYYHSASVAILHAPRDSLISACRMHTKNATDKARNRRCVIALRSVYLCVRRCLVGSLEAWYKAEGHYSNQRPIKSNANTRLRATMPIA